jgi:hypothetical protein
LRLVFIDLALSDVWDLFADRRGGIGPGLAVASFARQAMPSPT